MTAGRALEGTVLSDRYTLTERIAVGGMGEVWAATDTVLERTVAVKLLNAALSAESDFAERFRAEARHTAALQHPNIATVFDYGEDDGTAYLVMELVPGRPLSQIIAERAPLPAQETVSILIQAASALAAAHESGVVHRDVKPANIMVTPDGTAKLTDFGISRIVDSAPLTQTGQVLGTAQYLSPEQALGQSATAASDIYALGIVGHEMLTGVRPFDSGSVVSTALAHVNQPPPPLPETVPAGLRDVIDAALAKDPADRPGSAAEMAHALGMPGVAFASDAPVVPVPPVPPVVPVVPVVPVDTVLPVLPVLTSSALAASALTASALAASALGASATTIPVAAGPSVDAPEPTRAMPAPTRAMPTPTAGEGWGRRSPSREPASRASRPRPSLATSRRSTWLVGAAALVLGVIAFVTMSQAGGNDATSTPPNPATTPISATSTPNTSATSPVTSSVARQPAPGKGQDNGKKKGKQ